MRSLRRTPVEYRQDTGPRRELMHDVLLMILAAVLLAGVAFVFGARGDGGHSAEPVPMPSLSVPWRRDGGSASKDVAVEPAESESIASDWFARFRAFISPQSMTTFELPAREAASDRWSP